MNFHDPTSTFGSPPKSGQVQITATDLESWFVFLAQTPTKTGKHRAASTVETYARSVRAFCCWLVQRGDLPYSPLGEEEFPRTSVPFPHLIQPETFDRLVQAAFPQDAVRTHEMRNEIVASKW